MIGEIAALGAALAFGLSTVLARRFMTAVTPEAGVLVSITMNVTVFVTLTLGALSIGRLPPIHPTSIALFVAGGLAGTLVGRNLTYMSIERLGPSMSTSIRLTNSVFGLLFGLVLLRELPRVLQLVGLAVVTVGLWLGVWSRERATASVFGGVDVTGLLQALASSAAFGVGDTVRRMGLGLTLHRYWAPRLAHPRPYWRTCCGPHAVTRRAGRGVRLSVEGTSGAARPVIPRRSSCC